MSRCRRSLRRAGVVLATLVPAACAPQCAPPTPAPPPAPPPEQSPAPVRYDVQVIAGGLENPWDLAWTPDGTLLVTERTGDINVARDGGGVRIGRPADVRPEGEGGMMGLAVDPNFASNARIYACYLTAVDVRVVRFTVGAGYSSLGNATPLITGMPRSSTGRHSGCRVRFGPDGNLWVTTGDAANGTNPQNLGSLGGKVLRITTEGGIPAGNMGGPNGQIYAYGFRNPQGITFRPSDGSPFIIEHGSDRDDEITELGLIAGGNGGWNPVPGYNESVPMTDLAEFPGALQPIWSSGFPTIAPSGGTFVNSAQWGTLAGTHIAMAVLKGQELRLVNTTNGAASTIVSGQGRLRVAVEGPDGNLWVLTDANPGRILKVTPVR